MAIRTNSGAVRSLLINDYDLDNEPTLVPFIQTASAIVSRVATCAADRDWTLNSTELELIERWLAAHFYVMSDQPYSESATQKASAVYQGRTGMYLEASKYGQTAIQLDTSGCLKSLALRQTASISWLGKPPSEQIDEWDRD